MKILIFVSSRCPHCPKAEAVLRKVVPEYQGHGLELEKIRVKTSEGKRLAAGFGIRSLPTILMLDNEGNETYRVTGVPSESNIKNKIEKELGLKKSIFSRVFGG